MTSLSHSHRNMRAPVTLEPVEAVKKHGQWYRRWLCPACRTITLVPLTKEELDVIK